MDWVRILAYVTGTVDQELLARNEYLAAENRILKAQLKGRLKLSDAERATLGEIGHRLGRKVLGQVATVARPDTILGWYRKLVAHKFDGSKARRGPGRPQGTDSSAVPIFWPYGIQPRRMRMFGANGSFRAGSEWWWSGRS
jgi:putative transposase